MNAKPADLWTQVMLIAATNSDQARDILHRLIDEFVHAAVKEELGKMRVIARALGGARQIRELRPPRMSGHRWQVRLPNETVNVSDDGTGLPMLTTAIVRELEKAQAPCEEPEQQRVSKTTLGDVHRCQFCTYEGRGWANAGATCPECKCDYNAQLAQDEDDG